MVTAVSALHDMGEVSGELVRDKDLRINVATDTKGLITDTKG